MSASVYNVEPYDNYKELREKYVDLRKQVFTELSGKYREHMEDSELLDLYKNTEDFITTLDSFHKVKSSGKGFFCGTQDIRFGKAMDKATKQMTYIKELIIEQKDSNFFSLEEKLSVIRNFFGKHGNFLTNTTKEIYDYSATKTSSFRDRVVSNSQKPQVTIYRQ